MSTPSTRHIALTPELEAYIEAQVATGHHRDASAVVWAGPRPRIARDRTVFRPRVVDTEERPAP